MRHQTDQVISTFRSEREDTVSTGLEQIQSLQKENDALKEQVVRLQKSRSQLQEKLRRSEKRRRLHAKSYLDCLCEVTEERMQLKEVERERQAETERWRKREEEWRVRQTRTNGVICILHDQIQALKRDKDKLSKRGRFHTIQSQDNYELKSEEDMWTDQLRHVHDMHERQLALRDEWRRRVSELEGQKQKNDERRERERLR